MSSLQQALSALQEELNENKKDTTYSAVVNFAKFWHELPEEKRNAYDESFDRIRSRILPGLEIDSAPFQKTPQELQILSNPDRLHSVQFHIGGVLDRYAGNALFISELDDTLRQSPILR